MLAMIHHHPFFNNNNNSNLWSDLLDDDGFGFGSLEPLLFNSPFLLRNRHPNRQQQQMVNNKRKKENEEQKEKEQQQEGGENAETKTTATAENAATAAEGSENRTEEGQQQQQQVQKNKENKNNHQLVGRRRPRFELIDDKEALVLRAETPGVPKENLKVQLQDGRLTISGEDKKEEKGDGFFFSSFGSFEHSWTLPAHVDRDNLSASYADGVLNVRLPKRQAVEAKPILIE